MYCATVYWGLARDHTLPFPVAHNVVVLNLNEKQFLFRSNLNEKKTNTEAFEQMSLIIRFRDVNELAVRLAQPGPRMPSTYCTDDESASEQRVREVFRKFPKNTRVRRLLCDMIGRN